MLESNARCTMQRENHLGAKTNENCTDTHTEFIKDMKENKTHLRDGAGFDHLILLNHSRVRISTSADEKLYIFAGMLT